MNNYLMHYWNLFYEFVEAFRGVIYKRIPLPLLSNFYKYLPEEIRVQMRSAAFGKTLRMRIAAPSDIQQAFDTYIRPLHRPIASRRAGVALVNMDYLRFHPESYQQILPRSNTVLLSRGGPTVYHELPVHHFQDYAAEAEDAAAAIQLEKRALQLLEAHRKHAVFGHPVFRTAFLQDVPRMARYLTAVQRLLDRLETAYVVVGTTEDMISRILVLTAASRGIPSLCLQHGLIMGEEAYLPVFATHLGVYGTYEMDWYRARGVPGAKLQVIGHPRYDRILVERSRDRAALFNDVQLDSSLPAVLVATQPSNRLARWKRLIARLAEQGGIQVVVKPHPLELSRGASADYTRALSGLPGVRILDAGSSLHDWLSAVDAIVVESSTVGLEGMLHGKPTFSLNAQEPDRSYDYYQMLGPLAMHDPVKLADRIGEVLGSAERSAHAHVIRKQFLKRSYPIQLSGPLLRNLIGRWVGVPDLLVLGAFENRPVKGDGDEVYLIKHGRKRHIVSLEVFAALRLSWEQVCYVDPRILKLIPEGEPLTSGRAPGSAGAAASLLFPSLNGLLLKGNGEEVYVLVNGQKRHIASERVFDQMKLDWNQVTRLDDRIICSIPSGPFYG